MARGSLKRRPCYAAQKKSWKACSFPISVTTLLVVDDWRLIFHFRNLRRTDGRTDGFSTFAILQSKRKESRKYNFAFSQSKAHCWNIRRPANTTHFVLAPRISAFTTLTLRTLHLAGLKLIFAKALSSYGHLICLWFDFSWGKRICKC